ncbi:MAG: hypothetical protein GXO86_00450, partial [Chlorobi bacterium]|nr:hypothetical protein [Chlorobiota bacterium]
LPVFENAGVKVIRVGLHPSEGLLSGDELIAGPFHPSFRELVLTEIWWDLLKTIPERIKQKNIEIHVPVSELNYAVGYEGKNRKRLLTRYKSVKFIADKQIPHRESFFVV